MPPAVIDRPGRAEVSHHTTPQPQHHRRGFLIAQDERAAVQFHHLAVIQGHPKPV